MSGQGTDPLAELFTGLASSERGLTGVVAASRLRDAGPNAMAARAWRTRVLDLIRAVANPLVIILIVAGTASAFLGEVVDAAIIGGIVLASVALGGWQTLRSARAVSQLQQQIAPTAEVCRDGEWREIPRREIVAGDRIKLGAGDMVPADARLVAANDLRVQQTALTGESFPAEKAADAAALAESGPQAAALVYLGTSVVSGTATALVSSRSGDRCSSCGRG